MSSEVFSDVIVLIPAYNEAERIGPVLQTVLALDPDVTIVVVDDGSADETSRVARENGAQVLRHPFNLGYGAALQTGYKFAWRHDVLFVVQMDADGQHDAQLLAGLLQPVRADEADVVIGSRFLEQTGYHMGFARSAGSWLFQRLAGLSGLAITDPTSGFQALNRKALAVYTEDFFPTDYPDVDVLLVAHRRGLRIAERSVVMSQGSRPSTLHGGLRTWYYVYRLALSLWAGHRDYGQRP